MTGLPRRPVRLVVAAVALLLAGCASQASEAGERLSVVATMSVVADFAEQVGGDRVDVTSLVETGGDPHVYEPRPSDSRAAADADLVVANGVGLEPWLDSVLGRTDPLRLGDELDVDLLFDEEDSDDPHLWMAPPIAKDYVMVLRDALTELDSDGAEEFAANAEDYLAELDALDEEIREILSAVPAERRKLVTSHDAYSYWAETYDFEVLDTVVGVTTEEQPSAAGVRAVVDAVRAEDVPTIFVETTVNPDVIERIARDADVEVGDALYGDSVGEPGSGVEDYVSMQRANAQAIADGLGADA